MKKALFVDLFNLFYDLHGIYSLASVMKKRKINVEFIGDRNQQKVLRVIDEKKPDYILYSSFLQRSWFVCSRG